MAAFKNKLVFITGATRGIGRAIALKFAKEGATIIITGKTQKPHASLPGTLDSVAEEVNALGGVGVPYLLDVRQENAITEVVEDVAKRFGKIDVLVNNASAIHLENVENCPVRRLDLMYEVNMRATFCAAKNCIPFMPEGSQILTLSPPINLDPKWFKNHLAYTFTKYGMSMCTLGLAEELRAKKIAVNSLWPKTTIATMAIKVHFPPALWQASRHPEIMADAAWQILKEYDETQTGKFFIDEEVLREAGVTDFDAYAVDPAVKLYPDLFL